MRSRGQFGVREKRKGLICVAVVDGVQVMNELKRIHEKEVAKGKKSKAQAHVQTVLSWSDFVET